MNPTDEQALQFAVMLSAGLPASQAILYFTDSEDPAEIAMILKRWTRAKTVRKAINSLMRKPWDQMSLDERMSAALDQHYNSLAYLLFSNNYVEVGSADKAKLDTARQAIEAKMAGTAGKMDAMSKFFDDVQTGRVVLPRPVTRIGPSN